MKLYLARCATLAVLCVPFLVAQHPDTTTLKQVIIFGRHGVRTPTVGPLVLNGFSALTYPVFAESGQDTITQHGKTNETILGGYFRLWLTQENLLTGNDNSDAAFVYARANNAPLIVDTAQAFVAGLLPAAQLTVNTVPAPDPLFDPIDAGVAKLDNNMAMAAVNGRLGGNAQSISTAYAAEFALTRAVLFNYPVGTTPPPPTPAGKTDVTTVPITITPGNSTAPVTPGGLADFYYAIDPFMMEYADGMSLSNVGWGNLNVAQISQIFRVYNELLDFEYKTPYLAAVQSSNLGSHIVRTMLQAATGTATSGAVGSPSDKIVVLTAANTNLVGLAGLFHLDWLVAGDQPDVAALGGAIVFQLRQSQRTGEFIVRVAYITQTMDQLRNLTPLTLTAPPANVPVFIPGCSIDNATFDCPLSTFVRITQHQIDPRYADLNN
ncbi:MAG TPA: histidine-type phosphatase [Bryobacteraceae bacterium]|nr:histidine-type phosphatase [Bryobacteraceae bacterium]